MLERLGSTASVCKTAQGAPSRSSSTGGPGTVCPGRLSQVDRQSVRVRRLRAMVGIITRRSDEVQPEEGGRGGGVCPGEEGRDQRDRCQRHCRPHESLGGASAPTKKSDGNDDATTEKKPVTTANPDNGIVSPPSGTSKSTPMARALDCCTFCCSDPKVQPPSRGKRAVTRGGANGTRTRNPLLAKQVRYQLRHGPVSRAPSPRAARPTHDGTPVHRYEPISEPPQSYSASGTPSPHHLYMVRRWSMCSGVKRGGHLDPGDLK